MAINPTQIDFEEEKNDSIKCLKLKKEEMVRMEMKKSSLRNSTIDRSMTRINGTFISKYDEDSLSESDISNQMLRKKRKRSSRKSKATNDELNKIRIKIPRNMLSKIMQPKQTESTSIIGSLLDDEEKEKDNEIRFSRWRKTSEMVQPSSVKIVINKYETETQEASEIITFNSCLDSQYPNEIKEFNKIKQSQNHLIPEMLKTKTYINCDLKYFNLSSIRERIGSVDVILCDPPWRIRGGQRNDSRYMFSNSIFKLNYNTLSYADILSIKVELLSDKGFCFLWVLNSLVDKGIELLVKWGYRLIDQIVWVKLRNNTNNSSEPQLQMANGYYLQHSFELCLIGFKCPKGDKALFVSKQSCNVILSPLGKQSQKPEELYDIIEQMIPGGKKIELFARNNNLRHGWLSLGNQLGEEYLHWNQDLKCDFCKSNIDLFNKRFKSIKQSNYDICEECFNSLDGKGDDFQCNYFSLNNDITEMIYHEYILCNNCQCYPINGLRFKYRLSDSDLCEVCYDKLTIGRSDYDCLELPEPTDKMVVHYGVGCKCCYRKPVIGICFKCNTCLNYALCLYCFFNSKTIDPLHFNKDSTHELNPILVPIINLEKITKCKACNKMSIKESKVYQCQVCNEYFLCEQCFNKRESLSYMGTTHQHFHTFQCFES